ncbi:HAUS augmin-like complex subunit 5 [Latimeria chalumnae]|uniref:HAUS augmin-like complex subunit 5 n=1 Tax=Latimeria chalumnae TaxID=7897 RepID=UPI00313EA750
MEHKTLAQELKKWVSEEMGLPARKLPPDSMFRKLCLGQCADIWKHVTQHVCSQRTVKKIRGNLYWYTQLQQSEVSGDVCIRRVRTVRKFAGKPWIFDPGGFPGLESH